MTETKEGKLEDVLLDEVQKINLICFYLIDQCEKTNAERMVVDQKNVVNGSKKFGNWRLTIEKINE